MLRRLNSFKFDFEMNKPVRCCFQIMLEEGDYLQQMHQSQKIRVGKAHNDESNDAWPKLSISMVRSNNPRNDHSDYELRQTLGVGGFGTVRKAVHKPTGQVVAVKICMMNQDDRLLESIEKEIKLQRTVLHSNIAQIYEVARQQDKFLIFMEHCRNGELFQRINKDGPLSQKDAAKVFHQILSALVYLRSYGLSHRDIKPENILFDDQWNAKLIDFGFGCDGGAPMRTTICGTPSYTPPQIIRRHSYDSELVDVWSLGVTLYAMLAAELPFEGQDFQQRKKNILACRYRPQPSFSSKAQKLLASIFVDSKYRPRLTDLLNSEFMLAYDFAFPDFINLNYDIPETQEKVIECIEKNHRIQGRLIRQSVRNCQFDRNRALYYLTLKSIKDTRLNLYKKKKRSSLIKLDSLAHTTFLSKNKIDTHRLSLIRDSLLQLNTPLLNGKMNLSTPSRHKKTLSSLDHSLKPQKADRFLGKISIILN